MKARHIHKKVAGNESGFVLVLSMMIMVVLVVIGTTATNSSRIELQIAGNDKLHKMAFYDADAGIYGVPKLISEAINDGTPPSGADQGTIYYLAVDPQDGIYTTDDGSDFYEQIMGYAADDGGVVDLRVTADVEGDGVNDVEVDVNVKRASTELLVGGGVEFGSGAEGAGVGSTGGIVINYEETAEGSGPNDASADLMATYRKIPGVAGGL